MLVVVAAAYFATAKTGLSLSVAHGSATPVWAPTGISIAALLIFGKRMWPAVAAGALMSNLATPVPALVAVGIAAGNTAEALVAIFLLQRAGFRASFERVRDVFAFVSLGALASTAVSATVGVTTLLAGGVIASSGYASHWMIWWVGDMMGALLVAPVFLLWIGNWRQRPRGSAFEALGITLLLITTCAVVFSDDRWIYSFLLFPTMLWTTLRFRQHGATLATLLVALFAVQRILTGTPPAGSSPTSEVEIFQALIGVIGLSLLVLAATTSERLNAEISLTQTRRAEEQTRRALAMEHEAHDRLKALDELKTTFLHAVSHDLRTPLSSILGLSVTLERPDLDLPPAERQDLAHRIAVNARKLDKLLSDLLDLERLDRGILEPDRSPTDVGAIVRNVVRDTDLGDRELHVYAEPTVAAVDRAKVERIIDNLLTNEARHTPPGTDVWVSVQASNGAVIIKVEDSGPGIPEEARQSIFQPFGRVAGPEADTPGLGIGLSLVAKFAELHGGRAWVEERDGGGAAFRVLLPASGGNTHFT